MPGTKFQFQHMGIGDLLRLERLVVPPNQRSYAWEETHVRDLFQDLSGAIEADEADYFLGTIVLTQENEGPPQVTDGQQRLATVTILLSKIRDQFIEFGRETRAIEIDNNYIKQLSDDSDDSIPKLRMNIDDDLFFSEYVTYLPDEKVSPAQQLSESNEKIRVATSIAGQHVKDLIAQHNQDIASSVLLKWVNFIRNKATVVVVRVPTIVDAYRMFETLNDRGLRASQADLLKNYFFSRAPGREHEVQGLWGSITGAIETIGDDSDLVTYIRHYWITQNGQTRERDLADHIRLQVTSATKTINLLSGLDNASPAYVALFNPDHPRWNPYKSACRNYIRIILNDLRVEQIRPLMFATAHHFDPDEATKAFRLFVSWSVRYLVVGGRGGFLDSHYAQRAYEIGSGSVKSVKELADRMKAYLPNDLSFEEAFATARVSKSWLARYYLRALDLAMVGETEPEVLANVDKEILNTEHILPKTPGDDWDVEQELALACQNRLGNLALLKASKNVSLGNSGFNVKKKEYAKSVLSITNQITHYDKWTLDEINDRQKKMAKLAVKVWSLDIR